MQERKPLSSTSLNQAVLLTQEFQDVLLCTPEFVSQRQKGDLMSHGKSWGYAKYRMPTKNIQTLQLPEQ